MLELWEHSATCWCHPEKGSYGQHNQVTCSSAVGLADKQIQKNLRSGSQDFSWSCAYVSNFADNNTSLYCMTKKGLFYKYFRRLFVFYRIFNELKLPSFKYCSLHLSQETSPDLLQYNFFFLMNICSLLWWMAHQSRIFLPLQSIQTDWLRRDVTSWLLWLRHWGFTEWSDKKSTSPQRGAV